MAYQTRNQSLKVMARSHNPIAGWVSSSIKKPPYGPADSDRLFTALVNFVNARTVYA